MRLLRRIKMWNRIADTKRSRSMNSSSERRIQTWNERADAKRSRSVNPNSKGVYRRGMRGLTRNVRGQ